MTAVAEHPLGRLRAPHLPNLPRLTAYLSKPTVLATLFAAANAVAFMLVRPGVNDLWAARARASAVSHGVGLTYWFAWFGGGSTPGNYSVLTPYLSAVLSAELVGALSAVAITVITAVAVRGTTHPVAATVVATVAAAVNLWSGRVPFLLGSAIAIGAIIAVRRHRPVVAAGVTMLSILASPVSAAFLALGLAGVFLTLPKYRAVATATIATVVVGFGLVALAFGAPGPQGFSIELSAEAIAALALFTFARIPDFVRSVIWLSMITVAVMYLVPNGLGSNFGRMIWFCLPVLIVATSRWNAWIATLVISPVLLSGAFSTVSDLRQAGDPTSDRAYYQPLARELDHIKGLNNFRLEVVSEKAQAAYDALLDHGMLARGWETQEDVALNRTVLSSKLDPTSYKIWLDNNSVGYVALPRAKAEAFPEYRLVAQGLPYLHQIWTIDDWTLYRVSSPTPILAQPQTVLSFSQSKLVIRATCACTFTVRIRYSKYLRGDPVAHTSGRTATLVSDGYGYTSMTTTGPGDYVLHGSSVPLLR
jgi:hypothetical protein